VQGIPDGFDPARAHEAYAACARNALSQRGLLGEPINTVYEGVYLRRNLENVKFLRTAHGMDELYERHPQLKEAFRQETSAERAARHARAREEAREDDMDQDEYELESRKTRAVHVQAMWSPDLVSFGLDRDIATGPTPEEQREMWTQRKGVQRSKVASSKAGARRAPGPAPAAPPLSSRGRGKRKAAHGR
jgi:hypothetical protein